MRAAMAEKMEVETIDRSNRPSVEAPPNATYTRTSSSVQPTPAKPKRHEQHYARTRTSNCTADASAERRSLQCPSRALTGVALAFAVPAPHSCQSFVHVPRPEHASGSSPSRRAVAPRSHPRSHVRPPPLPSALRAKCSLSGVGSLQTQRTSCFWRVHAVPPEQLVARTENGVGVVLVEPRPHFSHGPVGGARSKRVN